MPPARISLFLAVVLLATSQVLAPPPPPLEGSYQSSDNYLKLKKLIISERSLKIQFSEDTPPGEFSAKILEGENKKEWASINKRGYCVQTHYLDPKKPYTVTLKPANSQKTTEIDIPNVPASPVDAEFQDINGQKLTWIQPDSPGLLKFKYFPLSGRSPCAYIDIMGISEDGRLIAKNPLSLAKSLALMACNVRGCSDPVFVKGPKWDEEKAGSQAQPPVAPEDLRCEKKGSTWEVSWTHPDSTVKFLWKSNGNQEVDFKGMVSDGRFSVTIKNTIFVFGVTACNNDMVVCSDPALVKGPALITEKIELPLKASEQSTQQEVAESSMAYAAAGFLNQEIILDTYGVRVRNVIMPSESAPTEFPAMGSPMLYSGQETLQGTAQAYGQNPTMDDEALLHFARQVLQQMYTSGTSSYSPQDGTGTAQAYGQNPTMDEEALLHFARHVLQQMDTCGTSSNSPQDDTDEVLEERQDSLEELRTLEEEIFNMSPDEE